MDTKQPEEKHEDESKDLLGLYSFRETFTFTSFATIGIFVLGAMVAVKFAKPVLLPVVLAQLLTFVFRPLHIFLQRFRVPKVPAAALLLLLALLVFAGGLYSLSAPVAGWAQMLPRKLYRMEYQLRGLSERVETVSQVAQQVDEMAEMSEEGAEPRIEVERGRFSDAIWAYIQDFLSYAVLTFIMLFFMLAYGERFYRKLGHKSETSMVVDEVAASVSNYLATITAINIGLGIAIGVAMWLLGLPTPVLWGVMATSLNFVPFLGALTGVAIIAVVAAASLDSTLHIAAVPVSYFLLTSLEGTFVTPMVLGRRFTINPIIIFVWLLLWGWLWGIPGALIAVPLLMAFRIVCEHVRALRRFGELMSL